MYGRGIDDLSVRWPTLDPDEPAIWTKYGNINESLLVKFSEWEFPNPTTIVHIVGARLKANGEIVKRGVYVYTLGHAAGSELGQFR